MSYRNWKNKNAPPYHTLPEATSHGTFFRFEGPCIIVGCEKEITLVKNELCSIICIWSYEDEVHIWCPYERCTKA